MSDSFTEWLERRFLRLCPTNRNLWDFADMRAAYELGRKDGITMAIDCQLKEEEAIRKEITSSNKP